MKFRSFIFILTALAILFCGCGKSASDTAAPDGMKLFSNEYVDYTAYIPVEWIMDMSTGTLSAYANSRDVSNINITAQAIKAPTTVDDYWKSYEEDFKTTFEDMEYVGKDSTKTTLDGYEARRYIYTATVTGNKYKFMQVVCIKDLTAYVITYTSTEELFDEHMEDIDKVLANFSFND